MNDNEKKEIAEQLRVIVRYNLHSSNIKALADKLDPPHRPVVVPVIIPPVREWLVDAVDMTLSWNRRVRDGKVPVPIPYKTIITRAEAERMEATG